VLRAHYHTAPTPRGVRRASHYTLHTHATPSIPLSNEHHRHDAAAEGTWVLGGGNSAVPHGAPWRHHAAAASAHEPVRCMPIPFLKPCVAPHPDMLSKW
jgi:hypothetical protein